jgi:hypothetical protein
MMRVLHRSAARGQVNSRQRIALVLAATLVVAHAAPAFAYLKFGVTVGGRPVTVKWSATPARYFVTNRASSGLTATDIQQAVGRAFATWEAVPTSSISYQFAGFTAASPGQDDGLSTIGFLNRPEQTRVLATTSFLIDNTTGDLVEADIFFNAAFPWSVSASGESGRFDLESIALHEIGHFSGLGHSALGETELRPEGGRRVVAAGAAMFPIAFAAGTVAGRTLRADDIAGISDIYPDGNATASTGSISGRVTKNGEGVFGAHVVAFDLAKGEMVGNFSLSNDGRFVIARLSPGPHVVRVEPLDDADVDGFFTPASRVDLDFRVTYGDRLVVVPRAGDSGSIELKVSPK